MDQCYNSVLLGKQRKIHPQGVRAAAAAKSLQSCLTLCDPIDGSPPGYPIPGILQARTLEWVAISFSNAWKWKVKVNSLSRVRLSDSKDCSLPGSSVHGILQARVLEWGARAGQPKRHEEKRGEIQFWLLLLFVVSPPPEPALCKKMGGCLLHLRHCLQSSTFFCFIFAGFFLLSLLLLRLLNRASHVRLCVTP